jgi:hypothetical protein
LNAAEGNSKHEKAHVFLSQMVKLKNTSLNQVKLLPTCLGFIGADHFTKLVLNMTGETA